MGIVKGYASFSAARVGPYCIVSGFVTGKGKKLGTLPKKCWPKQKLIFDVASNVPGALVKINVAGVVEVDLSGHVKGQKARKLRLKKAEARMASNERTAKAAAKKKGKKKAPAKLAKQKKTQGKAVGGVSIS